MSSAVGTKSAGRAVIALEKSKGSGVLFGSNREVHHTIAKREARLVESALSEKPKLVDGNLLIVIENILPI